MLLSECTKAIIIFTNHQCYRMYVNASAPPARIVRTQGYKVLSQQYVRALEAHRAGVGAPRQNMQNVRVIEVTVPKAAAAAASLLALRLNCF